MSRNPQAPHTPLISIVVCTHNRAHMLPGTVESLLGQNYAPAEIVILDDGSTDDTARVLEPYGSRVRYVHQANRGIAIARSEAARLAAGELIAFHDDDDPMPRDRLVLLHDALRRFPEAVMAVGDWADVDSSGSLTGSRWLPESDDCEPRLVDAAYEAVLWPTLPVAPHTTLFRKADGEAVGWFDRQFRYAAEDKDFFARLALRGPIAYVPRVVSYLRRDPSHTSLTDDRLRTTYFSLFLYRKHLPIARARNPKLYRRLQQRIRLGLERISRQVRDGSRPEYLPAEYADEWLALVGVRERITYRWRTGVRHALARRMRRFLPVRA